MLRDFGIRNNPPDGRILAFFLFQTVCGYLSFRAPTRNPGTNMEKTWLLTLDSASERGMTDTHRLIEVRLLSYYLYTELDVNLGFR